MKASLWELICFVGGHNAEGSFYENRFIDTQPLNPDRLFPDDMDAGSAAGCLRMEKTKYISVGKKIAKVVGNVLFWAFLLICIFAVMFTLFSKKDVDGAAEIFGMQMRVVTTDSMDKCNLTDVSAYKIKALPPRTMVFIEKIPADPQQARDWYSNLRVGDVLTFRYVYTSQVTITHRITSITEKSTGGYIIELAGDNKNAKTGQLYQTIDTSATGSPNYVVGKVAGQSYLLGFFVSLVKSDVGIICILIVPSLLIVIIEVMKIAEMLVAEKKKKEAGKSEETPECSLGEAGEESQ